MEKNTVVDRIPKLFFKGRSAMKGTEIWKWARKHKSSVVDADEFKKGTKGAEIIRQALITLGGNNL